VVCTDLVPTGEFARDPDWRVDAAALVARLRGVLGEHALLVDGQRLAGALIGDPIAANMFMLGAAWQSGQVPLSLASIDRAIELNGVAVEMNRQAFLWGRRAAHDPVAVERSAQQIAGAQVIGFAARREQPLAQTVARRVEFLTRYRNAAHARRYAKLVEQVRDAEARAGLGDTLAKAVAQQYFRLLSPKDEWEVARLYASPEFRRQLEQTFEGGFTLRFHVGAWPFGRVDPKTGKAIKREVGPWLMSAMRAMARLRWLRGSLLDPFRNSDERRLERRLLAQYESDVAQCLARLDATNHAAAVELASLPERIRGFGHVKAESAALADRERAQLLVQLAAAPSPRPKAA